MLILDEHQQTRMLVSVTGPTISEYFWVLDFNLDMDYTLAPIEVLEETTCPTMFVQIDTFVFPLPATWNVLVFDQETSEIDVVEVKSIAGKNFVALCHGPNVNRVVGKEMRIVDYSLSEIHVAPALNKNQMLCHPISTDLWISVAPSDTYNKYLKDKTIGDIL